MKKRYTYTYSKTVVGRITVTAESDAEAEVDAYDFLERMIPIEGDRATERPQDIEVGLLDLKDVEPDGPDRTED